VHGRDGGHGHGNKEEGCEAGELGHFFPVWWWLFIV
jgi:hypothetical protein